MEGNIHIELVEIRVDMGRRKQELFNTFEKELNEKYSGREITYWDINKNSTEIKTDKIERCDYDVNGNLDFILNNGLAVPSYLVSKIS